MTTDVMHSELNVEISSAVTGDMACQEPRVRFCHLAGLRPPRRADRSVGGTLPVRALRYCEAVTSASANGWYAFLPCRFRLKWDGHEVFWQSEGMAGFEALRSVHLPGFADMFDAGAPEGIQGYAPPFLSASIQPGLVQIWTGSLIRSAPGWSALVRPVANLPRPSGYELYEGIIETDRWFGPLFTNVRLTRTDVPVEFDDDIPFLQVQVLERGRYDECFLADHRVDEGLASLTADDWARYTETVVKPSARPDRRPGKYAVDTRKEAAERQRAEATPA